MSLPAEPAGPASGHSAAPFSVSPRVFAIAVGVVLAIVGFVALSTPVHADGVACGSGFGKDTAAAQRQDNVNDLTAVLGGGLASSTQPTVLACDSAVSTRQTWSWPLVGVGVLAVLGGAVVRRQTSDSTAR